MADIIIVESPYAGDISRNEKYLRRAMKSVFAMGEIPFASHAIYPQVLDDLNEKERQLGIEAGYSFWKYAKAIRFFLDYGMSKGMELAFDRAIQEGFPIEVAYIGENDSGDYYGRENACAFGGMFLRVGGGHDNRTVFHEAFDPATGGSSEVEFDFSGLPNKAVRLR